MRTTIVLILTTSYLLLAPNAFAAKRNAKKDAPKAEPAALDKAPRLSPKGCKNIKSLKRLRFGMSPDRISRLYNCVIERDHLKRYQEVEPGIQLKRLKAEIEQKKQAFKHSLLLFNNLPTPLDGSEISGEYTKNNGESVMEIKRRGKQRYLFFMRDKLWKIVDVYPLGKGAKWGATFHDAVTKIEAMLAVEGRVLPANANEGRNQPEVDWADNHTHLRLLNWGSQLGIAYVRLATERRLGALRTAKTKSDEELDSTVKDALR